MKEVVTEQHHRDEHDKQIRMIGIFIINNRGEMLLHKKINDLGKEHSLWEPLCLIEQDPISSPQAAAEIYLAALGMDCDLHEAFMGSIIHDSLTKKNYVEHVIIALGKKTSPDLHPSTRADGLLRTGFATDSYKWLSIDSIMHDVHEHPTRYAGWFLVALEGVALYVKNLLKNHSNSHLQTQPEIV